MNHRWATGAFLLLFLLLLPGSLAADTVVLRNGTTYRNVRAKLQGEMLIVLLQGEVGVKVPVRDVLRIVPSAVQVDPPVAPASPPTTTGPRGENKEGSPEPETRPPASSTTAQGAETDRGPTPPPHKLTWLEFASGPLPGLSPYFFHDRPVAGALSGGLEVLALYPALLLAASPRRAPLERYLPVAYVSEVLSPSGGGQGYGGGGAAFTALWSTVNRAWMIQEADRLLYGPVRDPIQGGYTGIDRYLTMRNRAYALFATAVLLDSLSLVLFHSRSAEIRSDTRRGAQEPRWRASIQLAPDPGTADPLSMESWASRPGHSALHFRLSRCF